MILMIYVIFVGLIFFFEFNKEKKKFKKNFNSIKKGSKINFLNILYVV